MAEEKFLKEKSDFFQTNCWFPNAFTTIYLDSDEIFMNLVNHMGNDFCKLKTKNFCINKMITSSNIKIENSVGFSGLKRSGNLKNLI